MEVRQSAVFASWLETLRDREAQAFIARRLRRMALGLLGDAKSVGEGVSELRLHHGPGYRLYYVGEGSAVVILLCGGDKDSQTRDIKRAHRMAKEIRS